MDDLPRLFDDIGEHLACESSIPLELAARFLCALGPGDLISIAAILSRYLPDDPKDR